MFPRLQNTLELEDCFCFLEIDRWLKRTFLASSYFSEVEFIYYILLSINAMSLSPELLKRLKTQFATSPSTSTFYTY